MTLWVLPVRMSPAEIFVQADKADVFHVLTPFLDSTSRDSPRVIAHEPSGALLVEFHTSVTGLLGRRKTHRTVERVVLQVPDAIDFAGVQGPLALLRDRISLTEEELGTRVRYESTIGLTGSVLGWLLVMLYVKPVLQRFMRDHLRQLKVKVEGRG